MTDHGSASRNERGSSLLLAMLVLAVLLLMGSAFLSTSLSERSIAVNETNSGKAFNFAEAGIEHTRALLPTTDIDALLTGGGNVFNNQILDQGRYTVDLTNNIGPTFPRGTVPVDPGGATDDTDSYLVASSTGNFRAAERAIDVVLQRATWTVTKGLYGRDRLWLAGHGVAYTDVATNADIEFTGVSPAIDGDADAAGTVTDPSFVTGTSTDGVDPEWFADIPCPTTAYGGVPAGAGVSLSAAGDLNLTGGTNKTYAGGTYYYRDFRKVGVGDIIVPVGQVVDIYISRELDIGASGFVNLNASAAFLSIWACGSDTSAWSMLGNAETYFTLYAPNHPLTLGGSGDKHGSFVAGDLKTIGNADYYFDTGITLPANRFVIVPGTWTESGL